MILTRNSKNLSYGVTPCTCKSLNNRERGFFIITNDNMINHLLRPAQLLFHIRPTEWPSINFMRLCLYPSNSLFLSLDNALLDRNNSSNASSWSNTTGIIKSFSFPGAALYRYGFSSTAKAFSNLNCLFLCI
jgi:hypothetical protein